MSWIKSKDLKPEYNVSVLVFIPEEDNHVTTGMWDISKKWVLLDEYRVPRSEVTYWRPMVDRPKDRSYTPTTGTIDLDDTTTEKIRSLQKQVFDLQCERDKLAEENERLKNQLSSNMKEIAELKAFIALVLHEDAFKFDCHNVTAMRLTSGIPWESQK